jgi:hypothetical protein
MRNNQQNNLELCTTTKNCESTPAVKLGFFDSVDELKVFLLKDWIGITSLEGFDCVLLPNKRSTVSVFRAQKVRTGGILVKIKLTLI